MSDMQRQNVTSPSSSQGLKCTARMGQAVDNVHTKDILEFLKSLHFYQSQEALHIDAHLVFTYVK